MIWLMVLRLFRRLLRLVLNSQCVQTLARIIKYKRKNITLDKILLGGESDLSGWVFALMSGDYARPSRPISSGPHFNLLSQFNRTDGKSLTLESFMTSNYGKNVQKCIDLFGEYFPGIKTLEDSKPLAEYFLTEDKQNFQRRISKNPVELVRIKNSNYYQLRQGNHRAAMSLFLGNESIPALVHRWKRELTPVQFLLNSLRWEAGEKVLYQPLPFPEISTNWTLARKCEDRLIFMRNFLEISGTKQGKSLDIGSYYGWFVNSFLDLGFDAYGVEKDNIAYEVGRIAFPRIEKRIEIADGFRFLEGCGEKFEVVSCLSVIHHLITGREIGDAVRLLQSIDRHTEKIFFFEMGQGDEDWFKDELSGWTIEYIEKWVLENTTFTNSTRLGFDSDGVGSFHGNYGRTLFAFTR